MLTSQRKQQILELLQKSGQVVVQDLSREWDLSEDTIRRDLRELAKDGLLQRVHGGALPSSPAVTNYAGRSLIAPEIKERLGRAAARLIQPGQIVAIDGGTTNVQLVRNLPKNLQATVVTHSPSIAVELVDHGGIEVIFVGGKLFKHSMVCVGSAALEAIEKIRTDVFFMGATGVHRQAGVTTGDFEDAQIKRAFSNNAAETILLASPEKLHAASAYLIVPLEEITTLVVEETTALDLTADFTAAGVSILRV